MTASSAGEPSRGLRVALSAALAVTALAVALGVGRAIGLSDYELGRALGQSLMIGLGAAVVLYVLHAQHLALRVVFAIGALGLVAMLTVAVPARRTHLEPADREAPAIVEGDVGRRLVHRPSGLSLPLPYEVTPTTAEPEGAQAEDLIAWGWSTPGGAITWSMSLDRAARDDAGFREHVTNVLEGARESGMTSSDVVVGDHVARASCEVQGVPCRVRIDSFTAPDDRHWSSVIVVIQEDTAEATSMLDAVDRQ